MAKLVTSKYSGHIDDDDIKLIMGALKESPREKIARLKRFGII